MKLWLKLLIACGSGLVIGLILPLGGGDTLVFMKAFAEVITGFGTYILFPLVLTQVCVTSYELRQDTLGLRFVGRSILYLLIAAGALAFVGGLTVLLFPAERIPIIIEEANTPDMPSVQGLFQMIFAPNALMVFSGNAHYFFAVFVFAVILGFGMYAQKTISRPLLEVAESASRIFYFLNRIVVEIMIVGMAVLAGTRIVTLRETRDLQLFGQILLVIGVLTALIVFVIYPLVIHFVGKRQKPWAWLRHMLAPALAGAFSGNNYIPLSIMMRTGNEELNVGRRIWAFYYPMASILGRAGTAMVSSVAFIIILRSYSSLEVSLLQFCFVVVSSVILSFMLGSVPAGGVMASLALLSKWYGQGLEEGFLILQPAAPFLISAAVFLDIATQTFIAYLMHIKSKTDDSGNKKVGPGAFHDDFTID